MDAKAKVVAWIRPDLIAVLDKCRNDTHNGTVDVWMRQVDETYVPLIPPTDHESALAELESENRRLKVENQLKTRAVDRWVPCPDHRDKTNDQGCYMCQLERANKRTERLLTGLEALAGELDKHPEFEEIAALIRIIAAPEPTPETNEEERI